MTNNRIESVGVNIAMMERDLVIRQEKIRSVYDLLN